MCPPPASSWSGAVYSAFTRGGARGLLWPKRQEGSERTCRPGPDNPEGDRTQHGSAGQGPGRVGAAPPSAPPFELLESKLLPPQGPTATVSRAELISSLEGSGAPPLVLLSAGPGWGKTTLLAQWASRSQRPFAWVSVDERDNDPIVLLTYVAVALDRVSRLDPSVFDSLALAGVSVKGTLVPRLGAALAKMSEQCVLVLDDLHLLDNPACLDAIEALTRHVSEGSQMALSARGPPALPLAALRTRGLALEIGPDDLRMDETEARQLLSAAGVDLPDVDVAELTEHTEGWPAGLYLAVLSIRARGLKAKGAATFSGSDRLVSDYLRSELLAHLDADDLRFLTRTAVLRGMSGPLCDEVLEVSGSAAILESYARSNLFVVPLDANGEWYRYHHLFQELLQRELTLAEPDLIPRLLTRASVWCEANGQPETAIGYAQEAGDVDRVARLVELFGVFAYQSGRAATAERWFDWLEAHGAFDRNGVLAVLGAILATVWGRPKQADRWAEAAEHAGYDGTLPDGSPSIDSWLAVLRGQRCHGGVARMRADAEFALRTLARGSFLRPNAVLVLALSQWLAGEVDQVDDLLADAVEEGLELGAHELAVVALAERAALAIGRGGWVEAEEFAQRALSGRPPCADGRVPHQRIRLRAGGPRRTPPRGSPACARAPRPGAAPAASAHLRAAVPGHPDPPGACPGLPDARRRRRRRDDAARDRGRSCADSQTSARSAPRWTSCARA